MAGGPLRQETGGASPLEEYSASSILDAQSSANQRNCEGERSKNGLDLQICGSETNLS